MRGVLTVLERRELPLERQRQQAQRAQLIRCGDDDPPAGPDDARQLADERARILQVLDHLDGGGDVDARSAIGSRPSRSAEANVTSAGRPS